MEYGLIGENVTFSYSQYIHSLINENVRKTVFDNGVTVYVNYGESDYTDGEISVHSMDFKVRW